MTALADFAARNKGDTICSALKLFGLKPAWMEIANDQIAIGFEFISGHPAWTKAFRYDAPHATPLVFLGLINEWKNKVRRDIVNGQPSAVVQALIGEHGMHAVLDAMEDSPRGH